MDNSELRKFVKEYFDSPFFLRHKIILTNGQSIRLNCSEEGIIRVANSIVQNKDLFINSILVAEINPKGGYVEHYHPIDWKYRIRKSLSENDFYLPRFALKRNPKIYNIHPFRISVLLDNLDLRLRIFEANDICEVIRSVSKFEPIVVFIWHKPFFGKARWIHASDNHGFEFKSSDQSQLDYYRLQWKITPTYLQSKIPPVETVNEPIGVKDLTSLNKQIPQKEKQKTEEFKATESIKKSPPNTTNEAEDEFVDDLPF